MQLDRMMYFKGNIRFSSIYDSYKTFQSKRLLHFVARLCNYSGTGKNGLFGGVVGIFGMG